MFCELLICMVVNMFPPLYEEMLEVKLDKKKVWGVQLYNPPEKQPKVSHGHLKLT